MTTPRKLQEVFVIAALLFPLIVQAQEGEPALVASETFEARVMEIIRERDFVREDGSKAIQQDLRLRGKTGRWKDQEVVSRGVSELDVIDAGVYKVGDRVIVYYDQGLGGREIFTATDYVRRPYLYLLAVIFGLSILIIGRGKGARALLSLVITFAIIIGFIIPQILAGTNPMAVSVLGALLAVVISTYLTERWNRKSHIAVLSLAVSLLIALGLSMLFTKLARLTGLTEESLYLMSLGQGALNFQGLLLAGILIGTLGVLDDAVISQIETVFQLREANPVLSRLKIFKMAFAVGNSHLGAIVNTLFLTYAGASLPLLLLFQIRTGASAPFRQIINGEIIAVEVVRTLVGSVAIALALPLSTLLAVYLHRAPRV